MSIVSIIISTVGLLVIAGIIGYDVATDSGFANLFYPVPEPEVDEWDISDDPTEEIPLEPTEEMEVPEAILSGLATARKW